MKCIKEKHMFKCILMEIQTDKASLRTCIQRQSHSVLRSRNKLSDATQQLVKHCTKGIPKREGGSKGRRKREGGREGEEEKTGSKEAGSKGLIFNSYCCSCCC